MLSMISDQTNMHATLHVHCVYFDNASFSEHHTLGIEILRTSRLTLSDHDNTFHVTEMSALTTQPSATMQSTFLQLRGFNNGESSGVCLIV